MDVHLNGEKMEWGDLAPVFDFDFDGLFEFDLDLDFDFDFSGLFEGVDFGALAEEITEGIDWDGLAALWDDIEWPLWGEPSFNVF